MPNDKDWHDWYDVLRVPSSASADEIKRAFRKAALDEHADKSNHPNAHERAILVNKAGDILRDPKAKKQFDRKRTERSNPRELHDTLRKELVVIIGHQENKLRRERQRRTQAERRAEEAESQIARLEQTCLRLMESSSEAKQRAEEAERRAFRGKRFGESLPQKPHKYDFTRYLSEDDERCDRNTPFHCDICPESRYHAYPSLFEWSPFGGQAYPTYKCNNGSLGHCRACFDLQREFYRG